MFSMLSGMCATEVDMVCYRCVLLRRGRYKDTDPVWSSGDDGVGCKSRRRLRESKLMTLRQGYARVDRQTAGGQRVQWEV
jgi:hypothetical protein